MDLNNARTDVEPERFERADKLNLASEMKVGDSITLRILAGVAYREYIWWPTFAINKKTKSNEPSWRSVSLKKGILNPLDDLAQIDLKMKEYLLVSAGQSKDEAQSSFARSRKFLYAAIVRSTQGDKIRLIDVPWSVVEGISKKRKEAFPTGKLVNGLPYMYDIVISKTINSSTGKNAYDVTPFNCTTQGKIDAKYLEESKYPYPNKREFFTAEENEMIDACPWELDKIDTPIENEELKKMLTEFPIDLSRRQKNNPMQFRYFTTIKELEVIIGKLSAAAIGILVPHQQDVANILPGPAIFGNILLGKPVPEPTPPSKHTAISAPETAAIQKPQVIPAEVSNATAQAPTMTGTVHQAPPVQAPRPVPVAEPSRVAEAVAPVFTAPPGPAPAQAPVNAPVQTPATPTLPEGATPSALTVKW